MLSGLLNRKRNLKQGLEITRQTDKSYIPRESGNVLLKRELICATFPQRREGMGKIETLGYFGMYYPGQQALVICRNPRSLVEETPKSLGDFMQVSFSPHPSKVWTVDLRS